MIGRFTSILFVSFFQGVLVVIVRMIDINGSEKHNRQLEFVYTAVKRLTAVEWAPVLTERNGNFSEACIFFSKS